MTSTSTSNWAHDMALGTSCTAQYPTSLYGTPLRPLAYGPPRLLHRTDVFKLGFVSGVADSADGVHHNPSGRFGGQFVQPRAHHIFGFLHRYADSSAGVGYVAFLFPPHDGFKDACLELTRGRVPLNMNTSNPPLHRLIGISKLIMSRSDRQDICTPCHIHNAAASSSHGLRAHLPECG